MPSLKEIFNYNVDQDLAHNIIWAWIFLAIVPLSSGILVWGILPDVLVGR